MPSLVRNLARLAKLYVIDQGRGRRGGTGGVFAEAGFGRGTSRRTSSVGLSSRRPSETTWRKRLSSVQVRYFTAATNSEARAVASRECSLSTLRDDLALHCVEPLRSARIGTTTSRGSVLETWSASEKRRPEPDRANCRGRVITSESQEKGGNVTRPRAADDFPMIRARWRSASATG